MGAVSAAGGIGQRMDATHEVARLPSLPRQHVFFDPSRERVVDLLDGAVLVDHQHADVDHVEDRPEVGPFLGQRFFGPLAVGDVADDLRGPDDLAVLVLYRGDGH